MLDVNNTYSEDQDLAKAAGAYDSTNTLDKGVGVDEFGNAKVANEVGRTFLNIVVTETFTAAAGEDPTLAIDFQDSAAGSSFASTGVTVPAKALEDLTEGKVLLSISVPQGLKRYTKLVNTVAGHTMLTGKVSAWLGDPVRVG